MKKIIAVGATTQNNTLVNGQSMMFQLFVDELANRNIDAKIVDFGKSVENKYADKRVSGQFSYTKLVDNLLITVKFLFTLISNPGIPIYINTSQSKVGFIRDYLFINLGKFFNRKVIAHQFGANYQDFYSSQSPNFQKKIKKTLQKTDKIIVEGDFTKNQFQFLDNFELKVISIPNGLPQKIDETKVSPKTISSPIKIIYLSNLIEGKGFWDVLDAMIILKNKYKVDLEVVFAGKFLEDNADVITKNSNEARKKFQSKIAEGNLQYCCKYYEGLYGNQKAETFLESHFFILPSYYINEGQPVSILEALAYGCVPIGTNYRLIPSMINEDNGYFVEPKSPEQIAEKILDSIDNPNLYTQKSKNAIVFYHENFTPEKYVNKLITLF